MLFYMLPKNKSNQVYGQFLHFFCIFVCFAKWRALCLASGCPPPYTFLFRHLFISVFFCFLWSVELCVIWRPDVPAVPHFIFAQISISVFVIYFCISVFLCVLQSVKPCVIWRPDVFVFPHFILLHFIIQYFSVFIYFCILCVLQSVEPCVWRPGVPPVLTSQQTRPISFDKGQCLL